MCPVDGRELDEDAIFAAASLSKPVVARWALELAQRGEIDLGAPMRLDPDVVGAEPDDRLARITPAMVLSHSAGFPNWREPGQSLRLVATPGEQITYSGEGFEYLLAWLCEERGREQVGRELDDFLARMGMHASSLVDVGDVDRSRIANGLARTGRSVVPSARSALRACGTLHTTIRDYASFVAACMWPGDRSADAWRLRDLMIGVRIRDDVIAHTLGWASMGAGAEQVVWQHGDVPGFKHLAAMRPQRGDGAVVLTNGDGGLTLTRGAAVALGLAPKYVSGVAWSAP